MVLTREQSKNALEHILLVVFGLTATDPLMQALEADQIEDIEEFLSLIPRQIEALAVVDTATGTATPVRKPRRNLIHALRQYLIHREQIGDPIGENWTSLTREEFDAYRRSPSYVAIQNGTAVHPPVVVQPPPPPPQPRPINRDPVNDFKKGIKRDVSAYPTLKDEKQWDNWNRSLKALVHAHDIYHVIDQTYSPTTPEETELYEFKQKFMYAVFQQTVLTDQGKALVRAHEVDFDARAVYVALADYAGKSKRLLIEDKILSDDTNKVIFQSNIRHADDAKNVNLREEPLSLPSTTTVVKSRHDSTTSNHGEPPAPIVDPADLVGRTFLLPPQEDGQRFRARIIRAISDQEDDLECSSDHLEFLCSLNDDEREEILSYNDIMNYFSQEDDNIVWKFKKIISHSGPLTPKDHDWKGSKYNVMIEWENGEITSEPLALIAADDPVTCAIYARDHNLLESDGWKRFKSIAKRQKKLLRMVNQAKLRSFRMAPRYKFGFEVPRDYKHAMELDKRNGNTKWMDATALELGQFSDYSTFDDLGYKAPPPPGYKHIQTHLIYDVKHDGCHKARMVADGHLTGAPIESIYSGVVSLRGILTLIFIGDVKEMLDVTAPILLGAPVTTVEAATYGSEFIVAHTCVDQIVDLRSYLRYLSVPVNGHSYMIGDNKTVIDGATFPHANLYKRHNALSFHRVREAIASDMSKCYFIDSEFNPSDILSKHWGYQQIWRTLQPLLFWQGDTAKMFLLLIECQPQGDGE